MMMKEFEELTGIFPTVAQYKAIEAVYMDSEVDKQKFCEVYRTNHNGFAEYIRDTLEEKEAEKESEHRAEIEKLQRRIARLKAELDRELEWKPYTDKDSMPQERYEELDKACSKEEHLDDAKAVAWIASDTGFDRDKIRLITEIPVKEINRHRAIRETDKKLDRHPLYYATDWNYARFEVLGYTYEIADGELSMIQV